MKERAKWVGGGRKKCVSEEYITFKAGVNMRAYEKGCFQENKEKLKKKAKKGNMNCIFFFA